MHEYGICVPLVDAALRRADGRAVAAVQVRVGAAHRVVPEAFAQSFELAARGTALEGAVLDVVDVPMSATCRTCGTTAGTTDVLAVCDACGGEVDISGGDDLVLTQLTYRPS